MPMSGVRSQLLPWHGELSTRSLAPAASTAGWLASMASAGSLMPLGRYGVGGLPTDTLLSADTALARLGMVSAAITASNATRTTKRRLRNSAPPFVGCRSGPRPASKPSTQAGPGGALALAGASIMPVALWPILGAAGSGSRPRRRGRTPPTGEHAGERHHACVLGLGVEPYVHPAEDSESEHGAGCGVGDQQAEARPRPGRG